MSTKSPFSVRLETSSFLERFSKFRFPSIRIFKIRKKTLSSFDITCFSFKLEKRLLKFKISYVIMSNLLVF